MHSIVSYQARQSWRTEVTTDLYTFMIDPFRNNVIY